MTRRFTILTWAAAACAYLLIVLGAIVRITGSGMGCGDHWPLCNGRLFPPLNDIGTVIEWSHRLVASVVSVLVAAVALLAWRQRRPGAAPYVALGLVVVQVLLGAVTVKTGLTPALVVLHLATAMLLLAALLQAASSHPLVSPLDPHSTGVLSLTFVTVLFGALTANLGAAAACTGFPLCNGRLIPDGGALPLIHWTHRLLAYTLVAYVIWWARRSRTPKAWVAAALVGVQVGVAAAMVLLALPDGLQAVHVAVGAGVWAAVVIAAR